MAVSAVGSALTFTMVRRLSVVVVLVFVVLTYLYGPPATPAVRNAAAARCNGYAHGDYRSFRLTWHVGPRPHWTCWDVSRPTVAPVSLGWWTNPFV
jgi:hypothetical protein